MVIKLYVYSNHKYWDCSLHVIRFNTTPFVACMYNLLCCITRWYNHLVYISILPTREKLDWLDTILVHICKEWLVRDVYNTWFVTSCLTSLVIAASGGVATLSHIPSYLYNDNMCHHGWYTWFYLTFDQIIKPCVHWRTYFLTMPKYLTIYRLESLVPWNL